MIARPLLAAFATISLLAAGCTDTTGSDSVRSTQSEGEWSRFLDRTIDGFLRMSPEFAVYQGRH